MQKILVIEDQVHIRNQFLEELNARGFNSIGAEDGRVGVQKARKHLPDAIVCGTSIPGLNGYDVLDKLSQDSATAVIPVILLGASLDWTDLRKAMKMGAADYLTKTCLPEELLGAIATQLKKQTVLQKWYAAQPSPTLDASNIPMIQQMGNLTRATAPPEGVWQSDPQLSKVFRFIEANYHRPITLSDVARAVGYSPAYLTHLTRRLTGRPIQQWIIERRMSAARTLLLETNLLIEQIAVQVGYHHPVHFFRQFRRYHSTTPNAWRLANSDRSAR